MKTTNFLAIAIIAVASVTGQVVAQETTEIQKARTKSNNANERTFDKASPMLMKISPTETGCDIISWSLGASNSSNSSGGGMAVGKQVRSVTFDDNATEETAGDQSKIKLKEVFISNHEVSNSDEDENTEVVSKIANGKHFKEATLSINVDDSQQQSRKGKPQDLHFLKKYDNTSPVLFKTSSGKVSMQDFHFTVKCKGRTIPVTVDNDTCTFPEDLPDGTYDVVCSWSWGAHQTGTFTQKTIDCHLKIENGVCVDMAINEKGTAGTKSPK
jgi:hypothetical protein